MELNSDCKFCGAKGKVAIVEESDCLYANCFRCGATGSVFEFEPDDSQEIKSSRQMAIEQWNAIRLE